MLWESSLICTDVMLTVNVGTFVLLDMGISAHLHRVMSSLTNVLELPELAPSNLVAYRKYPDDLQACSRLRR
jgi:hypothetical protein